MTKTKGSARVEEKSELSCIPGLFTILDSHQSCANCKPVSNERPGPNKLIIDYSRKLDQCSRFDEECRKLHYEEKMASVNASKRSLKDLVHEDMYVEKKRCKEMAIKRLQCSESDAQLIDHLLEAHKGLSKKIRKAYYDHLSLYQLNRASNGEIASFSLGEIKKMLKHTADGCIHRGVDATSPLSSSTNTKTKKQGLKHGRELGLASETNSVRKKIDLSSIELKKHGVDGVLEANRILSARLIDHLNDVGTMNERSPRTLERIISSLEHDCWPVSSRRDSQQMRFSSHSTSCSTRNERQRICLSPKIQSTDDEAQDHTMDEVRMEERNNFLHDEDDSVIQSTLNTVSDNETLTNTADDVPSTPTSKYQEEQLHESPVSVLDQFFVEDIKTPSSNMFQTGGGQLKPRRLCFEECSSEPSPQEYISHYVHLVIKSSSLTWDELTIIKPISEEQLLHSSLFDEVEFVLSDSQFDTRLVFDHMNEVLSKIQRSHVSKPRMMCSVALEEVVIDEVMREAELYLLPRTQRTTLDQLVAKDIADCRLWVDIQLQTQHIVLHVADCILEDSILDLILETLY